MTSHKELFKYASQMAHTLSEPLDISLKGKDLSEMINWLEGQYSEQEHHDMCMAADIGYEGDYQ